VASEAKGVKAKYENYNNSIDLKKKHSRFGFTCVCSFSNWSFVKMWLPYQNLNLFYISSIRNPVQNLMEIIPVL